MRQEAVDTNVIVSSISALDWIVPAMWAVGILLPALGILGVVLFNVIHRRLISLGHEDRNLHQRIDLINNNHNQRIDKIYSIVIDK